MKQTEFANGNITRVFLRYVSLNIFSMLGVSVYILADTFFIANGVGSSALAALNLALPAWSFMSGLGLLIGVGGSTIFTISRGEKRENYANRIFSGTIAAALGTGILLCILALTLAGPLAGLLRAKDELVPLTETYIRIVIGFAPLFMTNSAMICFIRNDNAPNLAMTAMLIGSLSNIVLDYVFIYPLSLGIFGAALATGISPVLGLLLCATHFIRKKNSFHFTKIKLRLHDIRRVFITGIPSFVTEFSSGIVILVFNMVILRLAGANGVAAYGVIANIALVSTAIFSGIGQGIQPLVSHNFGARNMRNVRKILRLGCIAAGIFGVLCSLAGVLLPEQIVSAFIDAGEKELTAIAVDGMRIYFVAFLAMGFNILLTAFFAATASGKPSFLISMLRGFIL